MADAPPPLILALDVATKSGVCKGRPGETPTFETVKFSGEDHLAVCASAMRWISRTMTETRPDQVWIEQPMAIGAAISGRSNAAAIVRLNGLFGIMGGAAILLGARVVPVRVQEARQAFIGESKLQRDDAKRRALAMCGLLGWPAGNRDEGDAAAIWYFACACLAPRLAPVIHPGLWRKAAAVALGEAIAGPLL